MIKISVVIPVYNGEKYIKEAILSVVNQPYKNIEIICVNDGSKDKSLEILSKVAVKDNRIRIISQENKGVATARNFGVEIAKGEYVAFLDQDDIWVPNVVTESLIQRIERYKADIVTFAYYHSNQDINRVKAIERIDKFVSDPTGVLGENYRHHSSYFYLKEMLKNNDIKVDDYRHEDERFRMQCLFLAKSMLYINAKIFVYRNNIFSVTHRKDVSRVPVIISCIEGYKKLFVDTQNMKIKQYCNDTILHLFLELLSSCSNEKNAEKSMEYYYTTLEIDKYYTNRGWMSKKDLNLWKMFFSHRKRLICKLKCKSIVLNVGRKILDISILRKRYESIRYPMVWEGNEFD